MAPVNHIATTQSGIGMIEVLVSLVIVGAALLALVDVQTAALRAQKLAHFRLMHSHFSANLAERVRANMRGAHDGGYSLSGQVYPLPPSAVPSCIESGICSPQELAAADIHEWRNWLAYSLSGGWGDISGSVTRVLLSAYISRRRKDGVNRTPST
ncbi:type IV pilus modification protein PilV [Collimonas arenae]|uniref:type IV pilus modification protein PilV n=1 Tax=Collimonas arenae TaxID=279058 RepID=UPI0007788CE7|nr:type IV pilus modification protein PilV [Collimonas arenae]